VLSRELLELLHEAASIQRWNDHIRPHVGFSELDKQAHKMVFAWVLARSEEDRQVAVDWNRLVAGGIYEFLHRVKLTDLKPPVYYRLMEEKRAELNAWVLRELEATLRGLPGEFCADFARYLADDGAWPLEKRILKAAHFLATQWEFDIIYHLNSTLYGLEETRVSISNELEEHYDLAGVQKLLLKKKTHAFIDLVGQLRFQKRWAQTPRVPETTVLGHMLVVAVMAYLCSLGLGACPRRAVNNFLAGLLHDLPEVMTRDIVSPVKRSVAGLDGIIKEYEGAQMREVILPLLSPAWHAQLLYLTADEFANKVLEEGAARKVAWEELHRCYNRDEYSPVDGELLEACDKLAAFIEATLSISYGIAPPHLVRAKSSIYEGFKGKRLGPLDLGAMFDHFA
jgi:putative hydrolase of HD superfamily